MIKIWITYFYQVRNLPENIIPFSTAMLDPKWFHKFEGPSKVFVDDRGVINGLRIPQLVYPKDSYNGACHKDCPLKSSVEYQLKQNKLNNEWEDFGCQFMNTYFKHLWNNVDFDDLIEYFETVLEKYKELTHIDDLEIALLVHEAPSCPCAERPVLIRWFKEFGYDLEEWNPYE